MNDPLVQLWVIAESNGSIFSAHCVGCKAGLAESCSLASCFTSNAGQESTGSWLVRKLNARGSFLRTLTKARMQKQKTFTLLPLKDLRTDAIKTSLALQLLQSSVTPTCSKSTPRQSSMASSTKTMLSKLMNNT